MSEKGDKLKLGAARMIEQSPKFWGRGDDWNEGLMKAEIKKKIIERGEK